MTTEIEFALKAFLIICAGRVVLSALCRGFIRWLNIETVPLSPAMREYLKGDE